MLRRPLISTLFPYTTLFRSVAAEYKFDGNKLKAGSENNLVLVLILLATFIPLRLQTEWYQSYFHEKNWLKKYPAFLLGIFLRSEEHTSELQSRFDLVCRLLL